MNGLAEHTLPLAGGFECRFTTYSPAATRAFGERVGAVLRGGEIILLHGPLGGGKTCFVQGVCRVSHEGVEVVSPTFTMVNTFPGEPTIHHLDLYRVQVGDDLMDIGVPGIVDEVLDGRAVALVEWPQLFLPELGQTVPRIELLVQPGASPDERRWHGRGYPELPDAWREIFDHLAADRE